VPEGGVQHRHSEIREDLTPSVAQWSLSGYTR